MNDSALSGFNEELLSKAKLPEFVTIYDSTLRDGEQMPGVHFTRAEKIEIATMLDGMGVPQIEAGFPAVSIDEKATIKEITDLGLHSEILVLSRTCRSDIDAALDCNADMVMLFMASSDLHLKHKYKMNREEQIAKITDALEYAKAHGLKFSFSTEDSTRTDLEYIIQLSKLAEGFGATRIGISDTTGCILPNALGTLVKTLGSKIKVPLSVHLHNDFGLAVANALASVENGATAVACTINGMGERAGNVPTEVLAMALEKHYGINTGIDLSKLTGVCGRVSQISGVPLSKNHPWVGENAFRHESGIHVAAILSNPLTYECILPESVGKKREFVLGKHSGRISVKHRLDEKGIALVETEIDRVVERIKDMAAQGLVIDDCAFMEIVESARRELND